MLQLRFLGKLLSEFFSSFFPFQMSLWSGGWCSLTWLVAEAALLVHKKYNMRLPYHVSGVFVPELLLLVFLVPLELSRHALARRGNLTVRADAVAVSLALALPWTAGVAYFMFWQAYVLRVESILGAVELGFVVAQFVLGIVAVVTFNKSSTT